MNLLNLTVAELKRAAALKQQIDALNKELQSILGGSTANGVEPRKKRPMSAATKKRIAAAQKARWANFRRSRSATPSVKASANGKKKARTAPAK